MTGSFGVLVDEFEAWLRVPKVSWGEWVSLDKESKAALLIAAKRIRIEDAIVASRAQTTMGAAQLMAEFDAGDAWCQLAVTRALDSYQRRMGEKVA
jgi:hypothetical protein